MTDNVLFVTAFKDLGRENLLGFERSTDTYISWFKSLIMLPIRLICFCEKDIEQRLKIECNFYNTYSYDTEHNFCKYIDKENEIMNSESFKSLTEHRRDPEVNKPGYNNVNHNKIYFVNKAKIIFPTYTHYAWIDFGYIRDKQIPEQLDFSSLRDKIIFFSPNQINCSELLYPIDALLNQSYQIIYGSPFICPNNLVEWFYEKYYNMVMLYYANNLVDDYQEIVKQIIKTEYKMFEIKISNGRFEALNYFSVPLYIDAVIPTCLKDINDLSYVIKGIRKNINNIRNIYVVCHRKFKEYIGDDAIFIDETIFPFSIEDVAEYIFGDRNYSTNSSRSQGWYFQQLLKLYSFKVIDGISSNILIVDSETIFYNRYIPIKDNISYYTVSNEINHDYRKHIKLLIPNINIDNRFSGICHQMLFQKHILQNLFDQVETLHNMPFWIAMLYISKMNNRMYYSEYDLYFNFIFSFHKNTVKLSSNVKWDISPIIPETSEYTYITAHNHIRNTEIKRDTYKVILS